MLYWLSCLRVVSLVELFESYFSGVGFEKYQEAAENLRKDDERAHFPEVELTFGHRLMSNYFSLTSEHFYFCPINYSDKYFNAITEHLKLTNATDYIHTSFQCYIGLCKHCNVFANDRTKSNVF